MIKSIKIRLFPTEEQEIIMRKSVGVSRFAYNWGLARWNELYGKGEKVSKVILTLQRLKHVGFLYTFTSKYTRKHIRLMSFYKTFTTKDTIVSINDSIRLVSKPIYIFSF